MLSLKLPERRPKYNAYNGYIFAPMFSYESVKAATKYEARSDDVFVVTYPKCGTTWMQQICTLLFNDGQLPSSDSSETFLYHFSPFLEAVGPQALDTLRRPAAIKTHFPFDYQPYNPEAKYINVIRNPKDACVSFYHHVKHFTDYQFDGDFDDFLNCWLLGKVSGGHYATHVLSWWKRRHYSNVLCLFYEDMKEGLHAAVVKVASFLGPEYEDRIKTDKQYLANVIKHSEFGEMKRKTNPAAENWFREKTNVSNDTRWEFIRKGVIGDWRNHFSQEQSNLVNEWFHLHFRGTELEHVWDKYGVFN